MGEAVQTGLGFLAEELSAALLTTEENLPVPADGLNSLWWDTHIVQPLVYALDGREPLFPEPIAPQVQRLLKTMDALSEEPLGFMVQLRVTEPLAQDVMLAFLPHLTQLEGKRGKIFNASEVFSWISDYLDVDSVPRAPYTYEDNTMIRGVGTSEDFTSLFSLAHAYIQQWADVFDVFCEGLQEKRPLSYLSMGGPMSRESRYF